MNAARIAVRFLGAAATVSLLGGIAPARVFAHAEPAVVSPGLGANLTSAPAQVTIEMTQEMARRGGANDIDVFDASGKEVTTAGAAIDNGNRRKITVALPSILPPGAYTVKWKTLSAEDGDAEAGEYVFTYDPTKPAEPGRTNLKGDAPAPTTVSGDERPVAPDVVDGADDGMSWILVAAVAIAGLAVGSGATFLLVQRRG